EHYSEAGALEEALRCTSALLALRPDDDQVLADKERLLDELGRHEEGRDVALVRVEAAARRGAAAETMAALWVALARRQMQVGDLAGADAALEQALTLREDDLQS